LSVGNVHGRVRLPNGYHLAILPSTARFERLAISETQLSSNHNITKLLASVLQLLFAVNTRYSTRGDQVNVYGYAAFGLTVTAYALMSFINFMGNIVCPQYPAVYLIRTTTMRQAEALPGAIFKGAVGTLLNERQYTEAEI
jgi:hypothetical protein